MVIRIRESGRNVCVVLRATAMPVAIVSGKFYPTVRNTAFAETAGYSIMSTPSLMVGEKALSAGKRPAAAKIGRLL